MHRSSAPAPLNLSGIEGSNLEALIMRGLAKNPEERFENATEMRDVLGTKLRALETKEEPIKTKAPSEIKAAPAEIAKEAMPAVMPQNTVAKIDEPQKLPAWFVQSIIAIIVTAVSILFFLQLLRNVFAPH
jgi:hypothetical protein